jgi:anti-sigma regulatory factor (Ser/Thr protein kinase)
VHSNGPHLFFPQNVGGDFLPATAALYNLIEKAGFKEVILDFSKSLNLWPKFMVPFATMCRSYRHVGINFDIIMPEDKRSAGLLINTNWANLIQPEKFDACSSYKKNHVPALQFFSEQDHFNAVDASIEILLRCVPGIDHDRIKALEWSLNEITDNVLSHSHSPVGGIMQVMTFPTRKRVEFYVCDAGVTVPRTLRQGRPSIVSDAEAVRAAIEEGVTRDDVKHRGNGLYGTAKCCEVSGGEFELVSGAVFLRSKRGSLHAGRSPIPYSGTYVRASIGYEYDKLLEEALVFDGRSHVPAMGYIERTYHTEDDRVLLRVADEIKSFGTRESGRLARTKVENLMNGHSIPVDFDFTDVRVISSSFADEVFGKLHSELGTEKFNQLCRLQNVNSTVVALIDRAIRQRSSDK